MGSNYCLLVLLVLFGLCNYVNGAANSIVLIPASDATVQVHYATTLTVYPTTTPGAALTLTPSVSPAGAGTFSPASITFDPADGTNSQSFEFIAVQAAVATLSFASSDTTNFDAPSSVTYTINLIPAYVDDSLDSNPIINVPTQFSVYTVAAPLTGTNVTLKAVCNPTSACLWDVGTITFTEYDYNSDHWFTLRPLTFTSLVNVSFVTGSTDGASFGVPDSFTFNSTQISAYVDAPSSLTYGKSDSFVVNFQASPVNQLTVQPVASNGAVSFNPASQTIFKYDDGFNPSLTFIGTALKSGPYNLTLQFTSLDATNFQFPITPEAISPLTYTGLWPSSLIVGGPAESGSFRLASALAPGDSLTVTIVSYGNLAFNPSSFTLTPTQIFQSVAVSAIAFTNDGFGYQFSGSAKNYIADQGNDTSITIQQNSIKTSLGSTVYLNRGKTSNLYSIYAAAAPTGSGTVTVNVYSAGGFGSIGPFVFSATTLSYTFALTGSTSDAFGNYPIYYRLTGSAASAFSVPENGTTIVHLTGTTAINVPGTITVYLGQNSGPYIISVDPSSLPITPVTGTLQTPSIGAGGGGVSFSSSSFSLSASSPSTTFNVTGLAVGTFTVTYSLNVGGDAQFYTVTSTSVNVFAVDRPVVSFFPNSFTSGNNKINVGDTAQLVLSLASVPNGLTITAHADRLQFVSPGGATPNPANVAAGHTQAIFTVQAPSGSDSKRANTDTITFTVSGTDAALYSVDPISIDIESNLVYVPDTLYIDSAPSAVYQVYTYRPTTAATNGLTLTPVAPGVTFLPSTIAFVAGQTIATFTARPSTAGAPLDVGAATVIWSIGGTDSANYVLQGSTSIEDVNPRTIYVTFNSEPNTGDRFYVQFYVNSDDVPTGEIDITVVPTAGLTFESTSLKILPGQFYAETYAVATIGTYFNDGSHVVNIPDLTFAVTTSSNLYVSDDTTYTVQSYLLDPPALNFDVSVSAYTYEVGVWYYGTVTLDVPRDVVVTLYANDANVVFNPVTPTLVFSREGPTVQFFLVQISAPGEHQISYTLSGADLGNFYQLPSQEKIQKISASFADWSRLFPALATAKAGVESDPIPLTLPPNFPNDVTFTLSAENPSGTSLLVFNPSILTFSGDTRVLSFTVTPTPAAAAWSQQSEEIFVDLEVSGGSSSNYQWPDPDTGVTVPRTILAFSGGDVSYWGLDYESLDDVVTGNFYVGSPSPSIRIAIDTIPSDLTFSLQSSNAQITPPTIDFSGSTVAYFTVTPTVANEPIVVYGSFTGADAIFLASNNVNIDFNNGNVRSYQHDISISWSRSNVIAGHPTPVFTASLDYPAPTALIFTPTVLGATIDPPSFTFDGTQTFAEFRLTSVPPPHLETVDPTEAAELFITPSLSGVDAALYSAEDLVNNFINHPITVALSEVRVEGDFNANVGQEFTVTVTLDDPTLNGLIVTPVISVAGVTFNPASFVFPANSQVQQATVTLTNDNDGNGFDVPVVLSGTDALLYDASAYGTIQINPQAVYDFDSDNGFQDDGLYYGRPFYGSFSVAPSSLGGDWDSVTLTPHAEFMTFLPTSITFTSTGDVVGTFTAIYQPPSLFYNVYVFVDTSGPSAYKFPGISTQTLYFSTNEIDVGGTVTLVGGEAVVWDLHLPSPALAGLTISFDNSVNELTVSPPSVEFATGDVHRTVSISYSSSTFLAQQGVYIRPVLSGPDAQYYSVDDYIYVTHAPRATISVSSTVSVNPFSRQSLAISFPVNSPVLNDLTIHLSGPGVQFDTPDIPVPAGTTSLKAWFWVTDPRANKIEYSLSGTDSAYFTLNSRATALSVSRFYVDTNIGSYSLIAGNPITKTYTFSPIPDGFDEITITPTSQYLQFTPSTWTFTPEQNTVSYTVSAPGIYDADTYTDYVYYFVAGTSAGSYVNGLDLLQITNVQIFMRSFRFQGSDLTASGLTALVDYAFDVELDYPLNDQIGLNISAPDGLTFTPSLLIWQANTKIARCVVSAARAGKWTVNYAIIGTDANVALFRIPGQRDGLTSTLNNFVATPASLSISSPANVWVGQWLEYTIQSPVIADLTVAITSGGFGELEIVPPTVSFNSAPLQRFRVRSLQATSYSSLTFSYSGTAAYAFAALNSVSPSWQTIEINTPGNVGGIVSGSNQFYGFIYTNQAPNGTVTIIPQAVGLTFSPVTVTLDPAHLSVALWVSSNGVIDFPNFDVHFALSGTDISRYYLDNEDVTLSFTQQSININTDYINGYTFPAGVKSPTFTAYLDYFPAATVTVTPVSTGAVFSPSSLVFNAQTSSVQFTFTPLAVASGTIVWELDAASTLYSVPSPTTFDVALRNIEVTNYDPSADYFDIGEPQEFHVFLEYPTVNGIALTPAEGSGFSYNPPVINFAPGSQAATVIVSPPAGALLFNIVVDWIVTGPDAQYYITPTTQFVADGYGGDHEGSLPSLSVYDLNYNELASLTFYVGVPQLVTIFLDELTQNGVTVVPSSPSFSFSPSTVSIAANSYTATVTITALLELGAGTPVTFSVQGIDAAWFSPKTYTLYNVDRINVNVPGSIYVYVGVPSDSQTISLSTPISSDLTITPVGAGLTFTPPQLTFSPTVTAATFTVTAAYPNNNGGITVHYVVSGTSAGALASTVPTFNVYASQLDIQFDGAVDWDNVNDRLTVGVQSPALYVRFSSSSTPLANIAITPFAPGCVFTPASVTIGPINTYGFFTTVCSQVGQNVITLSYAQPTSSEWLSLDQSTWDFVVVQRTVFTPNPFADVYVGAASAELVLALQQLPPTSVTFTPFAVDTVFTPSSLVFSSTSSLYQAFSYQTNSISSPTVYWVVSGTDAAWYETPEGNSWSSLERELNVNGVAISNFYSGTSFTIAFSTPIAPEGQLVITPAGLATFSPSSVTITSANENPTIQVTPHGVGEIRVSYTLSGSDAAWYTPVYRNKAYPHNLDFTTSTEGISSNYPLNIGEYSTPLVVRTPVASPNGVTLIPSSPYLTFTPAVLTFDSNTLTQQFQYAFTTRYAYAVSSHTISFTVSGADAQLFNIPDSISFNTAPAQFNELVFSGSDDSTGTYVYVYPGIPSYPVGIRTAIVAPESSITLTPFTSDSPYVTFSPSSITLTSGVPEAFFTVTATQNFEQTATVLFAISGPGAELYDPSGLSLYVSISLRTIAFENTNLGTLTPNVPAPHVLISIGTPPTGTLTVTPVSVSGTVTFNPSSIDFSDGKLSHHLSITGTRPSDSERVYFEVSGSDAPWYTPLVTDLLFSVRSYDLYLEQVCSGTLRVNIPCSFRLQLLSNAAPTSNISVSLSAAGVTFIPSDVVISPPYSHADFVVIPTQEIRQNAQSPVLLSVADDADVGYVNLNYDTYSIYTEAQTATVSGCFYTSDWDIERPEACTLTLTYPALEDVVVTVWSNVASFPEGNTFNITQGQTSATIVAVGAIVGAGELVLSTSSLHAFVASGPYQINVHPRYIRFSAYAYQDLTALTVSITAGDVSDYFDFYISGFYRGNALPTPNNFTVSWIHSSAVRVIPEVQVVAWPASSFSVSFAADNLVAGEQIVLVLSGPDAHIYAQTPIRVTLTAGRRAFTAPNLYNPTMSKTNFPTFIVGVESRPFTLSAMTSSSDVFVQLSGQGLSFNPSVLRYTGTYESLTFTVTATSAYPGTYSYVHYTLTGPDAGLFNIPAPTRVLIQHHIVIPPLPSIQVGVPSDWITVQAVSNLTVPIVLSPLSSNTGNVYAEPSVLLLSPEKPYASFRLIGVSVQHNLGSKLNPNDPSDSFERIYGSGTVTNTFNFAYKTVAENDANTGDWIFLNTPAFAPSSVAGWGVSVIPGTVAVSFSSLKIGVTGYVNITVNPAPRSNLLITPIGNNLNFAPSSATFNPSVTSVTLQVTAVHADYATSDDIPFTVAYVVSGNNLADYVPPASSFLAVSRGGANAADDLVLGAAPALAIPSLLLAVVVAFVLIF